MWDFSPIDENCQKSKAQGITAKTDCEEAEGVSPFPIAPFEGHATVRLKRCQQAGGKQHGDRETWRQLAPRQPEVSEEAHTVHGHADHPVAPGAPAEDAESGEAHVTSLGLPPSAPPVLMFPSRTRPASGKLESVEADGA